MHDNKEINLYFSSQNPLKFKIICYRKVHQSTQTHFTPWQSSFLFSKKHFYFCKFLVVFNLTTAMTTSPNDDDSPFILYHIAREPFLLDKKKHSHICDSNLNNNFNFFYTYKLYSSALLLIPSSLKTHAMSNEIQKRLKNIF